MQKRTIQSGQSAPTILGPEFFVRPAEKVARDLIGKTLARALEPGLPADRFRITEAEAYVGPHDLACHAARGLTKRTAVMFGPPGHLYVYFCYGMHWMLNIVAREEGYPAGVLIRGIEGVSGPGRVARRLALDGRMNGLAATPGNGLWIEDDGTRPPRGAILVTPRIGINSVPAEWRDRKLRFLLSTE